jgi:hypothetical protein
VNGVSALLLAASAPLAEKSAKICDAAAEDEDEDDCIAVAASASESAIAAASSTTELRRDEGRQMAAGRAEERLGLADALADDEACGAKGLRDFDNDAADEETEEEVCCRRVVEAAVDGRAKPDSGCLLLDFADRADEDADAEAGRERALLLLLPLLLTPAFVCDEENTSDDTAGSLSAAVAACELLPATVWL